ncbi:MAG: ImmA/IrrE family metallo-endopeptidase [Rhizobiaceae bacterium]|nr:MAG: ImmA/IrrE family metallo-endopeptidase [Rhizobiaceae bacterium]
MPTDVLSLIPHMKVVYLDDSPIAASAHWDGRDWIIVVNARQREPRRRHSLAHELKHVVDHTTRSFLYAGTPRMAPLEQAERAADYFAGCLLMPFGWLRKASADDCRTANEYAIRFAVPVGAAKKRLTQVGLAPENSRQLPLLPVDGWPPARLDFETAIGAEA